MIPEQVHAVTSVTRLKTASFENPVGRFVYRHIHKDLFFGFEEDKDEYEKRVLTALPEKALLDFVYFHPAWEFTGAFLKEGIRLQNASILKKSRLKSFAEKFKSKKMIRASQQIIWEI